MEKLGYAAPIENTPDKENTEVAQDKSQSKNSADVYKRQPLLRYCFSLPFFSFPAA